MRAVDQKPEYHLEWPNALDETEDNKVSDDIPDIWGRPSKPGPLRLRCRQHGGPLLWWRLWRSRWGRLSSQIIMLLLFILQHVSCYTVYLLIYWTVKNNYFGNCPGIIGTDFYRACEVSRWAWPASNKGDGLQPYLAFVLAAEKHTAPIRLQTAYIT